MAIYTDTVLSGNTKLTLSAGDSAFTTEVQNGASVQILSGGYAEDTALYANAALYIDCGGSASATTLSAGTGYISSGGAAAGMNVTYLGLLTVHEGGSATDLNVTSGKVNAVVGGENNTTLISGINNSGEFYLKDNVASNFILYMNGWQIVSSGGTTCDITVHNSARLYLSSGASATGLVHQYGGQVFFAPILGGDSNTLVSGTTPYGDFKISNGAASGIMLCGNCQLPVSSGGTVQDAAIRGLQAKLRVYSGASAERTSIFLGALEVHNGGSARNTLVMAAMSAGEGAKVYDTVVSGGSLCTISTSNEEGAPAGVAPEINGLTVGRQGTLEVDIATTLAGTITIAGTAALKAEATLSDGTELVLDLAERHSDEAAIINGLNRLIGTSYTISASVGTADQYGFYYLASGAENFAGTITVTCGGSELGTLGVGESFTLAEYEASYKLTRESDQLLLTIADTAAPILDGDPEAKVKGYAFTISWNEAHDKTGVANYLLEINGETIETTDTEYVCPQAAIGEYSYRLKAVDTFGNASDWSKLQTLEVENITPQNVVLDETGASWDKSPNIDAYVAELSTDDFSTALTLRASTNALDFYNLGIGDYKFKVRADIDETYSETAVAQVAATETGAVKFSSNEDGNADAFFAQSAEMWKNGYSVRHVGTAGWQGGTRETAELAGKNRIANIFRGSTDASLLLLSDFSNGDVLALDDMFTASPDGYTARFQSIGEIRAGAGDDVVDLTSVNFTAPGVTIRGGDGDDVIWSGDGSNYLFGDAGNDRIIGGAGNDVICGGAGNDRMHGGGGDDIFTFAGNWGNDIVETVSDGNLTLWFSGIERDDITLLHQAGNTVVNCGGNSVTVLNRHLEDESLRFGEIGYEMQYAELDAMGAFADRSSSRIFEERNNPAAIASL